MHYEKQKQTIARLFTMKKTTAINIMVESEIKKKLLEKARALGLSLTGYIEKIAREPVIFTDENAKLLLRTLDLRM